jgi:hypothetical protein
VSNSENLLNQRLQNIISWGKLNELIIPGGGAGLTFSLCNKSGKSFVTFYYKDGPKRSWRGLIYAYINGRDFPGGERARDAFVNELKKINLYDENLDASAVHSHRHFRKNLQELTNREMDKFLIILGKYCKK